MKIAIIGNCKSSRLIQRLQELGIELEFINISDKIQGLHSDSVIFDAIKPYEDEGRPRRKGQRNNLNYKGYERGKV